MPPPKCPPEDIQRLHEQMEREDRAKAAVEAAQQEARMAMRTQVDALFVLQVKGCTVPMAVRHLADALGGGLAGAERAAQAKRLRKRMSRVTNGHSKWMRTPTEGAQPFLPSLVSRGIPPPHHQKEKDTMPQRIIEETTTTTTKKYLEPPEPEETFDGADEDGCYNEDDDGCDSPEPEEKPEPRRNRRR